MSRYEAHRKALEGGFLTPHGARDLDGFLSIDAVITDDQAAELKRRWKYGNRPKWIGPWVLDRPDREKWPDISPIWMRQYDDGVDSCWTWKVGPEVPW